MTFKFKQLALIALLLVWGSSAMGQIISAADYGLKEGSDAVPALRSALKACIEKGATKLIIPKGRYDCYPSKATEKYIRVLNNDNGMKRILFPLEGMSDFEIDAQGAEFILNGQMMAFDVERCEDIKLTNFSIDWNKPFYFQGEVVAVNEETNSFDLAVYEECDYEIVANELLFVEKAGTAIRTWRRWATPKTDDFGWEQNIDWNIWYDSKTKAPAYKYNKSILRSYNEETKTRYHVEELEPGLLRFFNAAEVLPKTGWVLIIKGRKEKTRVSPAMHLSSSKNVELLNINVHHAGGMGLIGERCENVTLDSFNIKLREGTGRMVSTSADATHFVNCKGLLSYNNCMFENMLDDAGNFHGIYTMVEGAVDEYSIGIRRMHGQQLGALFAEAGDSIRLSESESKKAYATLKVTQMVEHNEDYMVLTFDQKVKDLLLPNSIADNVSWQADIDFRNCTVRRNKARSLLISTQGNVLIENNSFSECTAFSILFASESSFWYESGPVRNVMIRNNEFKNFGLGFANNPVIRISPKLSFDGAPTHFFHKNIYFENNTFEVFCRNFLSANCVENLVLKGNTILPSKDYPLAESNAPVFDVKNARDVRIENNEYLWDTKATIKTDEYSNVIVKKNKGIEK